MTNVHKNIISFLIGSSFAYIFVWLISIVAALQVPELTVNVQAVNYQQPRLTE